MKQKTAVVGFGCAGYHAVKAMREHGDVYKRQVLWVRRFLPDSAVGWSG